MSDDGSEDPEAEETQEDALGEILAQPEKADEFYAELVTHDGLVNSWKRTLHRQGKIDKKMKVIQGHLNTMLAKFVVKEEFFAVRDQHAAKIAEFEQTISELVALGERLSSSEERHEASIENLKERMVTQEQFAEVTTQELQNLEIRSSERYDKAVHLQQTTCAALQQQVDELAVSAAELQAKEQECVKRDAKLKAEIDEIDKFLHGEGLTTAVEKHVDERLMDYINNERMAGERERIVGMVEERLIVPIREEMVCTQEVIEKNKTDVEHKNGDVHRIISTIENRLGELKEQLIRTKAEIMDEVEVRARIAELEDFEQKVMNMITEARAETSGLKNKCVSKLNEFSDHFAKVHKTMRDHEHCLTHHAEEIENRATKYGVLTLQNRFDQYVQIQKYEHDQDGLKQTLDWQSSQLEALCMGGMSKSQKQSTKNYARSVPQSQNPVQPAGDSPSTRPSEYASLSSAVDDDEDEKSTVYELQKQLELLSMGVLWLSHLSLRQPELGCSRQMRLESEQDLLGHLKNVRHWITHRSAPGDWDPNALLSTALYFTHPRDEEQPGPLPLVKPPGSAGSVGQQKPGSAGSHQASLKNPGAQRNGMKREYSAPLQTVAGLLGPSHSTQSLSAQSMPGLRKDPSQSYFNGSLPPGKSSVPSRRQPTRPLPMRKQEAAEDIGDVIMTKQGLNAVLPVSEDLAPF
eukprot:gnl/MRDRNA2_/MRDRNA2_90204_c0_seq2.p1 gnl/MRDRNA2_/MRDRNA2_90204_c0~~gnl/MRDRNA2_/MRDRNA2_90204_c0_seq2.p1  ORF type:complete len:692 (+),score=174.72 gnl/MRDRNA2_/MRDRNA2_90204_c0_seq2:63-2138(+)